MKQSRWPFWILIIVYVLATLLLHKRGNDFAGSFVIAYGGTRYREGVRLLSVAVGCIILPFLLRNLWKDRTRLQYLVALMPLALIIDQTMISVPLERIHYVQLRRADLAVLPCSRPTIRRGLDGIPDRVCR